MYSMKAMLAANEMMDENGPQAFSACEFLAHKHKKSIVIVIVSKLSRPSKSTLLLKKKDSRTDLRFMVTVTIIVYIRDLVAPRQR